MCLADASHADADAAEGMHSEGQSSYKRSHIRLYMCLADAAHGAEGAAHDDHHDDVFHTAAHIFEDQAITEPACSSLNLHTDH